MSARPRLGPALAGLVILIATLAAGCSTPSSSVGPTRTTVATTLDQVMVEGKAGEKPKITVPAPFSVQDSLRTVMATGTGAAAKAGYRVTIQYVGVNGTDGTEFDTSFGVRPTSFVLSTANNLPGLVTALEGVTAGSRLLLALPPEQAYGLKGFPKAGIGPTDTIVMVVDLVAVQPVLARATGTAAKPKAGLPTVTLGAKGAPTITLPKGDPPATLVVQPLIVGKGAQVARGQQITVHYTGVLWPGGTVFDSTWKQAVGSTFSIGTGALIAGWDRGLVGQPVGSQVLLIVPPDDGYGAEGKPEIKIKGTDTLVFVVDILDAA